MMVTRWRKKMRREQGGEKVEEGEGGKRKV